MLSVQLADRVDTFLESGREQSYLLQVLDKLATSNMEVITATAQTLTQSDPGLVPSSNARARQAVDKALAVCRTIKPFELSREVDGFQGAYQTLALELAFGREREGHYSKLIHGFKDAFTAVFQAPTYLNIPQLLQAASVLYSNILGDQEVLRLITAELRAANSYGDVEGFKRLTLYFESQQSLFEIQAKLAALLAIYSELCELLSISASQYPLRLQKIETGSLWASLLGYPKIIELMEKYIDVAIDFLHRTFTREGKLSQIPRNVEQIDSLLKLRESLMAQGIPVDQLGDNINKAAVKLSGNLNTLLGSEPIVEVNGARYSVGAELQRRMIEQRGSPMLTHDPTAATETVDQQP